MTFASVDHGDENEDEATGPEPSDSWYDDAPITDEQIEAVRRDLDTPVAQRGAAFAPFVVRKLLAEIDRLNTVLDANRVVRNAAESSCRTLKGVVHLLKTERAQLRSELADARGAMEILRSSGKEQCTRAETAERELAELRERVGKGETPDSFCPWCGMAMWLDADGLAPLHNHPVNDGRCPGIGRRPSDEWRDGEWKAADDG